VTEGNSTGIQLDIELAEKEARIVNLERRLENLEWMVSKIRPAIDGAELDKGFNETIVEARPGVNRVTRKDFEEWASFSVICK